MNSPADVEQILEQTNTLEPMRSLGNKIINAKRIDAEEALFLYEHAELSTLSLLSDFVRQQKNGNRTYFNRNFHIEPTNVCIYNCKFCSYARKINQEGAWEYTKEEILEKVLAYKDTKATEVHIVGGVHPKRDIHYYADILSSIKKVMPKLHIKAFTAVELEFMIRRAKMSISEGLTFLKENGLDSIPGGGAEIFDAEIRKELCDEKASTEMWLEIHEAAHKVGIPSNATMLYGHIENYAHRVEHMELLRDLQDRTGGFNTFIPLKFRKENNSLSHIGEVSLHEEMKNYAVARIFLDNFPHLKAYWPGIGKTAAQASLAFGVDDLDGTIDDSTKIYSLAGAEDRNPQMSTEQLVHLIKQAGKQAVERDTLYNHIREY